MFVDAFEKKYGYKPEWGAENAYMQLRHLGPHGVGGRQFYPPDVIKAYEKGETFPSLVGDVLFPRRRPPMVRPVIIVTRQEAERHEEQARTIGRSSRSSPGEPLMQKPDAFGCNLGDYT